MARTPTLEERVASLAETAVKQGETLNTAVNTLNSLVKKLSVTRDDGHPNRSDVFGAPNVRKGEDTLGSRGFSFMKMIGLLTGAVRPEEARHEVDIHNRLDQVFVKGMGSQGYEFAGAGPTKFLAPLASGFFHEKLVDRNFRREMKSMVQAGMDGADLDEMNWIRTQQLKAQGYDAKTLSWLTETTGGALVAPPEMGELIQLLRNKEALVNAGAKTVPLPPQGRIKYPRQTAASSTYWVGENAPITDSDIGTGEINLQAKKLAVMIKAPNELLRFATPAAEALMRDDMTKSLALGLDLACLEGAGGDNTPLGLINMSDIGTLTSSKPGGDNNTLDQVVGEDILRFPALVEEKNAEFEGFIMRPKTLYKYYQLRADAVGNGDKSGAFLFNMIREPGMGVQATLAGYPVTKSTQVSQSRQKNGGATGGTYIIGGMWSDCLIGLFGAIEFASTTVGDTPFKFDQTWVRGILSADFQVRHQAAFVLMDNLTTTGY